MGQNLPAAPCPAFWTKYSSEAPVCPRFRTSRPVSWTAATAAAGWSATSVRLEENGQRLTIHQLRHTFGSERAGQMDALVLRDLMGHKSLKTTLQYAQVNPGEGQGGV